jgi:predicted secreted protein
MIKLNHFILTLLLMLSLSAATFANDKQHFNQVNLQVTASDDIANDQLIAIVVVQETGDNPAILANKVNDKMAKIIAKANRFKRVQHQTINYNSQPIYSNGSIKSWQVSQNIQFKSQNFDQLGKLIAEVNQLSIVQSMHFAVSDTLIEQTQDRLTQDAISQFRTKAAAISKQFGKSSYHLVHINVGNNYVQQPRQMMMRSAMVSEMKADTAPALSAGTNKVSVNINGTIELY